MFRNALFEVLYALGDHNLITNSYKNLLDKGALLKNFKKESLTKPFAAKQCTG